MELPRTIPLLPCADIDEIEPFFAALGFRTTYRQHRPYACLALSGHGFDLQYYGLDGHTPESSHSSCLVIVDDTGQIWDEFAAGLREAYGKLPIRGFPRITRPRPQERRREDRLQPGRPGRELDPLLQPRTQHADSSCRGQPAGRGGCERRRPRGQQG